MLSSTSEHGSTSPDSPFLNILPWPALIYSYILPILLAAASSYFFISALSASSSEEPPSELSEEGSSPEPFELESDEFFDEPFLLTISSSISSKVCVISEFFIYLRENWLRE
jgi:hypothetical protein